jgi:hypothetical protein
VLVPCGRMQDMLRECSRFHLFGVGLVSSTLSSRFSSKEAAGRWFGPLGGVS